MMHGMMRSMLAELYGKLDPDGGVPADRSEDLLTEAVFGSLRYLPYTVALAEILLVRIMSLNWSRLSESNR
jgi:hypothetical protein